MAHQLQKTNYTHEALADMIIANPGCSMMQLAVAFGKTPAWVGYVVNSDVFQAHLAARKEILVDPVIAMTVDEKLKGVTMASLDVVMDKLHGAAPDGAYALRVMESSTKALGYGARGPDVAIQQNFVVALPGKAANSDEWAKLHRPGQTPVEQVTDAEVVEG